MAAEDQNPHKSCPNCGTTLADFRRTGLLGCAKCYSVFQSEVLAAVRRVQGRIRHTGKVPTAEARNKYALVIEQDRLYEGLALALREGRYADAEKIKHRLDEIALILHPREDLT